MSSSIRLLRPAGFDARPGRLSSLRAQARRNFRALTTQSNPLPFKGREQQACAERDKHNRAGPDDDLTLFTLRVRALYEDSAVPMREIARLAGVHERTLYKYARKCGWRRRNARAGCEKITKHRAPRGLKARDPANAAHAVAALDRAMALSDQALRRARALREAGTNARTLLILARMLPELAALEDAVKAAASVPADSGDAMRRELKRRIKNQVRRQARVRRSRIDRYLRPR